MAQQTRHDQDPAEGSRKVIDKELARQGSKSQKGKSSGGKDGEASKKDAKEGPKK